VCSFDNTGKSGISATKESMNVQKNNIKIIIFF
jgi:flagellar hook-associated protein FlgK